MNPLAAVIARLQPLPSPRGVALELMRLARRDDASIADVTRVMKADPALAGRLIRSANQSSAASALPTGSLHEAVLRLGFSGTRQIALGLSLVNDYRSGRCAAFDYAAFWTGSLLRGLCAQTFAARTGALDPHEAFACGLLADIGRLALATAQPQAYAELLDAEASGGEPLRRAERIRFGADHAELTVALLERWAFPASLAGTVREFHTLTSRSTAAVAGRNRAPWLLALAAAVARASTTNAPPAWKQVALDAAARLELDAGELSALAAGAGREAAEWAPLLALPVPRTVEIDYPEYETPGAAPCDHGHALDIVLVDDDEDDRYLAHRMLTRSGHRVRAVASAVQAIEEVASALPQLLITDWEMPGMDGPALCRALRETRFCRDLYLVMYTGRARDLDLVAGIEAGANDFVPKSAGHDVLLARVRAGARASEGARRQAREFREARGVAVDLAVAACLPAGAPQAFADGASMK
jgi:HD-like signal output (HDOD) protein/FixJ family two-component response regulator